MCVSGECSGGLAYAAGGSSPIDAIAATTGAEKVLAPSELMSIAILRASVDIAAAASADALDLSNLLSAAVPAAARSRPRSGWSRIPSRSSSRSVTGQQATRSRIRATISRRRWAMTEVADRPQGRDAVLIRRNRTSHSRFTLAVGDR
jgi:hypothetical protein